MKTGRIGLGGIPYRIAVHEGLVTFNCNSGVSCERISVRKCEPHGLLYVQATGSFDNYVANCHIERAVRIAEHFLGPNHFLSHEHRHRFERGNAAANIVKHLKMWRLYGLRWRLKCIWFVIQHSWRLWFPAKCPQIDWYAPAEPQNLEAVEC